MTFLTDVGTTFLMLRTPAQRYQADLDSGAIVPDAAQRTAVDALQDLHARLENRAKAKVGLLDRLMGRSRSVPEKGLYLWGGVGRGKTYLMDSFFDALSFEKKQRMHFNRFMQRVHEDLTDLAGMKNPLDVVADRIASETIVLCFDEFYVSDIGDAMLLGGLMQALFDRGITLVATSNIPPDGLYRDGLQRGRFLPAIRAVEMFTRVMNVDSGIDYRLRVLTQSELYFVPEDGSSDSPLPGLFTDLTGGKPPELGVMTLNKRPLAYVGRSEGVLFVSFEDMCLSPRSAMDYTQVAREFHSVLLSDVPVMTVNMEDGARRFITLVDEFYDRNIKLAVVAEAGMEQLYSGSKLAFEFQRTLSRLIEMQSVEYLGREHRP